ncbi:MAG: stalk domain-containing protein [Clostridia bacterium]
MKVMHKTSLLICLTILVIFSSAGIVVKWPEISQWLATQTQVAQNVPTGADPFSVVPPVPSYVKNLHPVYTIRATLDTTQSKINGQIELAFDNPKTPQIMLYLYDYSWNQMRVQSIKTKDRVLPFGRQGNSVTLANPFGQQQRAVLTVQFETPVPRGESRFGVKDDIWALTNWFPMLGSMDRQNRWYEPPKRIGYGDPFVYHYADYEVYFNSPESFRWTTSWGQGSPKKLPQNRQEIHYSGKQLINFTLVGSPHYKIETLTFSPGLTVDIASTDINNLQRIKAIASSVFPVYIEKFGPLPYPRVAIAETAERTVFAMEYANMAIIKKDLYWNNLIDHWLPHEIAHMWWYNSVATLEAAHGWVDEGLVEASVYYYKQKRYGQSAADDVLRTYAADADKLKRKYPYGKLAKRLNQFENNDEFLWTWYSRGAMLYHHLREEIGETKFLEFLKRVQRNYHGSVIGPEHLDQALGQVLGGEARYFVPNVQQLNEAPFYSPRVEYYYQTVLNGVNYYPTSPARQRNGTVYVPIREIMEKFGYLVSYDEKKNAIVMKAGSNELHLFKNSPKAILNNKNYTLAKPLQEINDKTMVPLSLFDQVLGYAVSLDKETKTVRITVPVK